MTKASDGEALLAFQLTAAGIPFRRERRFHPTRMWRLDFVLGGDVAHFGKPSAWAVEVDGGTWSTGRHTRGQGYADGCEKCNEATILGWRVLRVTTEMVEDGRALRTIERALA